MNKVAAALHYVYGADAHDCVVRSANLLAQQAFMKIVVGRTINVTMQKYETRTV